MSTEGSRGVPENRGGNPLELSRADQQAILQLDKRLQVIRDRVAGVALGYQTGLIETGRGGTCKSWTTVGELVRQNVDFKLHNSHFTSRALVDCLEGNPSAVHVFEDDEAILRDRTSVSVLRSALWGSRHDHEGKPQRLVSWGAYGASREFVFTGGIIIVTNRKLSDLPEVKALATRVPHYDLPVSDREIAALMRQVAIKGYRRGEDELDPVECLEVAEFVIRESKQTSRDLDMRLLINAFADRLQAEDHQSGLSWQDLVRSQICGRPVVTGSVEPVSIRACRMAREMEVAREILELPREDRLRAWQDRTGSSRATLYRRLRKLAEADAMDFDY